MCLELFHVLGVWELVALNAAWWPFLVVSSAEQYPSSWGETNLWAIVLGQFSFVVASVKFYFPENSLPRVSYRPDRINGIIMSDCDWRVNDAFDSRLLRAVHVKELMATVLHPNSVGKNDSINSTSHNNIILLAPRDSPYFSCMACESHSLRVLACIKLKKVQYIVWGSCKILSSIWKLQCCTVLERVDIFVITHGLSVFLKVVNT